jgi:hypothetical protein
VHVQRLIAELRTAIEAIDRTILTLERLASGNRRTRETPLKPRLAREARPAREERPKRVPAASRKLMRGRLESR